MTLSDWVAESRKRFHEKPATEATARSLRELQVGAIRQVGKRLPTFGRRVFDDDWDLLIVLDACRVDALQAVAGEYEWLPDDIPTTVASGTYSRDWMQSNFGNEYADEKARTAHVTWNAFSDFELDAENWLVLDEVWREVWDESKGVVSPHAVTDRAIATGREYDADRLLVHYMQPHAPYPSLPGIDPLSHDEVGELDSRRRTVWERLDEGELSRERVWQAYLETLRWVLDDVERLLENVDAEKAVLTADHGESFGQWGFYGHPEGVPLPATKRVPWVEVESDDAGTVRPSIDETPEVDATTADRLEALGYT